MIFPGWIHRILCRLTIQRKRLNDTKEAILSPIFHHKLRCFRAAKEKLQQQNADLKKQIATLNADLAKSQKESRLSVAYLQNLNQKIGLREKLYTNTQKEKRFIEDDIYRRQLEINKYNRELAVLRKTMLISW